MSLFNSSKKFASSATHQENTGIVTFVLVRTLISLELNRILICVCFKCVEKARFRDWIAHYNAVFDISWIKVRYMRLIF